MHAMCITRALRNCVHWLLCAHRGFILMTHVIDTIVTVHITRGLRAWTACVCCVRGLRAWSACVECMRGVHAWSACVECMRGLHAMVACVAVHACDGVKVRVKVRVKELLRTCCHLRTRVVHRSRFATAVQS
jgi:hypothetical protein